MRSIVLPNPFRRHPSPGVRAQYAGAASGATDEGTRTPRAGVAAHLVRCRECRDDVAFRVALGDAVQRLPTPTPSAELLARVQASRAGGDRLILPGTQVVRRPPRRRWMLTAASALVAAGLGVWQHERSSATPPFGAVAEPLVSVDPFTGSVAAEGAGKATRVAGGAVVIAHPERLRPRTLIYLRRTDSAGRVGDDGTTSLEMEPGQFDGVAAWRVRLWVRSAAAIRAGGNRGLTETVWAARRDLRPIAREVHVAPYLGRLTVDVTQRFSADSVTGRMLAKESELMLWRHPITGSMPRDGGPYLADPLTLVFHGATDLHIGWTGSAAVVGWGGVRDDVVHPMTLRVVGDGVVTVPAGTFDCWSVLVESRGHVMSYWIRKADGVAVRVRDVTPRPMSADHWLNEIVLQGERVR